MADCKSHSTQCEMDITKNMIATRPDICYTVTRLSQDLPKPNSFHLTKAKHVLCYLKGTINRSLIFKKSQKPLKLERFCDADWANLSDRKVWADFALDWQKITQWFHGNLKNKIQSLCQHVKWNSLLFHKQVKKSCILEQYWELWWNLSHLKTQQLFIVIISPVLFWQKTQSFIQDQNILI